MSIFALNLSPAPSLPPQNITVEYQEPFSLIVNWKPVPKEHRNGVIRGYRLTLRSISAINLRKPPNGNETEMWRRKMTVLSPSVSWVELRDVKAFTWYCINILAFTSKGDGHESSCDLIMTGESGKIKSRKIGFPHLYQWQWNSIVMRLRKTVLDEIEDASSTKNEKRNEKDSRKATLAIMLFVCSFVQLFVRAKGYLTPASALVMPCWWRLGDMVERMCTVMATQRGRWRRVSFVRAKDEGQTLKKCQLRYLSTVEFWSLSTRLIPNFSGSKSHLSYLFTEEIWPLSTCLIPKFSGSKS